MGGKINVRYSGVQDCKFGVMLYLWSMLDNIAGPGGRLPAEMVGSNPTGSIDVCLL